MVAKTGTIEAPSSTGVQAFTGIGFQPTALILFATSHTADADSDNTASEFSIGFSDGVTAHAISHSDGHGGGSRSWAADTSILKVLNTAGTILCEAEIVSFDADGFSLNFSTTLAGMDINFFAVAGINITNVKVGEFDITGTGNTAETGVGFTPDFVLGLWMLTTAIPSNGTGAKKWGMAFDDGSAVHTGFGYSVDNSSAGTNGAASTVFSLITESNFGAAQVEGKIGSMDADGFTVNMTTLGIGSINLGYLAIEGTVTGGKFDAPSSATTKAETGLGFAPDGLFTCFYESLLLGVVTQVHSTYNAVAPGGFDGSDVASCYVGHDSSPYGAGMAQTGTITFMRPADREVPSIDREIGIMQSLDADGFTLEMTLASAGQPLWWLAFGAGAAGGNGRSYLHPRNGSRASAHP